MPEITWADEFLPLLLRPSFTPLNVKSVLDVGCGRGILGCLLRVYRDVDFVVGIDIFRPYLDFARTHSAYDALIHMDLSRTGLPFSDREFDMVFCLEVMEHLERERGLSLLDELERVGSRIVVTTPGVFFSQAQFDSNPNQAHMSYYDVRDFERRGYRVFGVGSLRLLSRCAPAVAGVLGSLSYHFPRSSSTILALRDTP